METQDGKYKTVQEAVEELAALQSMQGTLALASANDAIAALLGQKLHAWRSLLDLYPQIGEAADKATEGRRPKVERNGGPTNGGERVTLSPHVVPASLAPDVEALQTIVTDCQSRGQAIPTAQCPYPCCQGKPAFPTADAKVSKVVSIDAEASKAVSTLVGAALAVVFADGVPAAGLFASKAGSRKRSSSGNGTAPAERDQDIADYPIGTVFGHKFKGEGVRPIAVLVSTEGKGQLRCIDDAWPRGVNPALAVQPTPNGRVFSLNRLVKDFYTYADAQEWLIPTGDTEAPKAKATA